MRELLPFEAYLDDLPTVRTAFGIAIAWGTPMAVFFFAIDGGAKPGRILVVTALAALLFGFGLVGWFRVRLPIVVRRLYRGDPRMVPSAPAGEFDWRLLCSWRNGSWLPVRGHLYIGPREWVLVPHTNNRRSKRAAIPISLGGGVGVELQTRRQNVLARVVGVRNWPVVQLIAPPSAWTIMTPEASKVATLLQQAASVAARAG